MIGHDKMVEQHNIHIPSSFFEFFRNLYIVATWDTISGWMIMSQNNTRCIFIECLTQNETNIDYRSGYAAATTCMLSTT